MDEIEWKRNYANRVSYAVFISEAILIIVITHLIAYFVFHKQSSLDFQRTNLIAGGLLILFMIVNVIYIILIKKITWKIYSPNYYSVDHEEIHMSIQGESYRLKDDEIKGLKKRKMNIIDIKTDDNIFRIKMSSDEINYLWTKIYG